MDLLHPWIDLDEGVEAALRGSDARIVAVARPWWRRRRQQLPEQRRSRLDIERQQVEQQGAGGAAEAGNEERPRNRDVYYLGMALEVAGKLQVARDPDEDLALDDAQRL
jgi:hypothetical protein